MVRVAQRLDDQEAENKRLNAKLEEQEKRNEEERKAQLRLLQALTEKVSRLAN